MVEVTKIDLKHIIGNLISVSDLSRGMVSKIIQKAGKDKDLQLLQLANSRMKNCVPDETASHDDVLNRYNIKEERLNQLIEAVEIE